MLNIFGDEESEETEDDENEGKVKKVSAFDYLNDISTNKQYLFDTEDQGDYNKFFINRGLAQHQDTILLANETNKRSQMTNLLHHDFLFYSIDSRKRFGKWSKSTSDDYPEVIDYLKKEFAVGRLRAISMLELMEEDELKSLSVEIKSAQGGKAKK